MSNSRVLSVSEATQWQDVLERCQNYDTYHLPAYYQLAEERGEGRATLFVFEMGGDVIAMPILLRQCAEVSGLEKSVYQDATSVYGYPGPVSNLQQPSEEVLAHFSGALRDYLKFKKVVTIFSRLNPLLKNSWLLDGIGQVLDVGSTVAIDLTLPIDVQYRQYRKSHRYEIAKAKQEGVKCIHDTDWDYLENFINIYSKTMQRVGASDYYFFDQAYFIRLWQLLGDKLHLFVAIKDNYVISGALFMHCNAIIQYHLSGTDLAYRDLAPNKLILDTARCWGNEAGAALFHLGGGVGGKVDGLFRFKSGFSHQVYQFKIWRMIVDPEAYQQLSEQKRIWNQGHGVNIMDSEYFPIYRSLT